MRELGLLVVALLLFAAVAFLFQSTVMFATGAVVSTVLACIWVFVQTRRL